MSPKLCRQRAFHLCFFSSERSAGSLGGRLGLISWVEDVLGCLLIMSFGPQREGSAGPALHRWESSVLREKQPHSEHADVHLDILGFFFI